MAATGDPLGQVPGDIMIVPPNYTYLYLYDGPGVEYLGGNPWLDSMGYQWLSKQAYANSLITRRESLGRLYLVNIMLAISGDLTAQDLCRRITFQVSQINAELFVLIDIASGLSEALIIP